MKKKSSKMYSKAFFTFSFRQIKYLQSLSCAILNTKHDLAQTAKPLPPCWILLFSCVTQYTADSYQRARNVRNCWPVSFVTIDAWLIKLRQILTIVHVASIAEEAKNNTYVWYFRHGLATSNFLSRKEANRWSFYLKRRFCATLCSSQMPKHTLFAKHFLWNIFDKFAQKSRMTSTNESVMLNLEIDAQSKKLAYFFYHQLYLIHNFFSLNLRRRLRNHGKFYTENLRGLWPPKLGSYLLPHRHVDSANETGYALQTETMRLTIVFQMISLGLTEQLLHG